MYLHVCTYTYSWQQNWSMNYYTMCHTDDKEINLRWCDVPRFGIMCGGAAVYGIWSMLSGRQYMRYFAGIIFRLIIINAWEDEQGV